MDDFILRDDREGVAVLTLNRPEVLNAWHKPMRDQLIEALSQCDSDEQVGAIVLTGAGERAFGAGQDFNEAQHFGAGDAAPWIAEWERLYDRIRSLSKPIVGALNGVAA